MSRAKYDPLEAAKIGSDEKPKAPASPPFKSADPPAAPAAPARPAPPTDRAPHYRVLETGRVSLDSQICTLRKDAVIDSAGYGGEDGIARLELQGLKLERVQ